MDDGMKNLYTIIISAYAAIISTIALILSIFNIVIENKSSIKIKTEFISTNLYIDNKCVSGAEMLKVSIVNTSKKKIININNPKLKLSYESTYFGQKLDRVNLIEVKNKRVWPKELKPGEVISLNYPFLKIGTEWFLDEAPDKGTFKVLVSDTLDKKYYSKKIKINKLKELVNHNDNVDQEIFNISVQQYQ